MSSYFNYGQFYNDLNSENYNDNLNCDESLSDYFFKSVGIFSCGLLYSFYVVSLFYKKDLLSQLFSRNSDYNSDFDEEDLSTSYEKKYYEDFRKLENNELTDEDKELLKNCILFENTPDGEVIMNYNDDTESFNYWCNNKNIKYMILDAVVHKYAIEYNCKSVCVDYKNEFDDGLNELRNVEKELDDELKSNTNNEKTNNETEKTEKSVFVKFKNYKTESVSNSKSKPKYLVTKNSNRFSYKGTVEEYYKSKNEVKKTKEVKKNISYSDFKKSNNQ